MAEYEEEAEEAEDAAPKPKGLSYAELFQSQNIVDLLDKQQLASISAKVVEEYEIDCDSRKDWEEKNEDAIDLAMMVAEQKTYPFNKASNVKYPLIATAALQFNARAYPAICPPDRVVKAKTFGADPDGQKERRAERVSEHMTWQCLEQMPEWEGDTDRLTLQVSILGSMYRKVFYNPSLRRKETRLISPDRLVFNYWGRFVDLPRITEKLYLYPYEIRERINDGRFAEFDYANMSSGAEDDKSDERDSSGPHMFLEQHRLLDLDEDGYPEPYVVTVHKSSQEVCRIVANWSAETAQLEQDDNGSIKVISLRKNEYYIQYLFLPSPDGGSMGMGFGWLLRDLNDSINTTLNLTFDAAHLANIQGGFVSAAIGPKQRNATFRFEQGEWKYLNTTGPLNQAIMPITYPGPSPVLMSLLEFLINTGKELASIKDVLTGETPATAPVGTTMALIEQGLQVFTSIYKRLYRSLKAEFKLHAELNREHVTPEEYQQFFDEQADPQADYDLSDMGILPISDPQAVTKAQKIAKAQAVYGLSAENPTINKMEATKRFLEAIGEEEIDQLIVQPPPPDPEVEALTKRAAVAEVAEKEGKAEKANADATSALATALKTMAESGSIDAGQMAGALETWLKMITAEHGMEMDIAGQGRVPGMAGAPNDAGGVLPPPGPGAGPDGGAGLGAGAGQLVPPGAMDTGAAPGGSQQRIL